MIDPDLKTTKDMFKKLYLLVVLAAALACNAAPSTPTKPGPARRTGPTDLQPDEQQRVVCIQVAKLVTDYNYKKVPLNDSTSALIYANYLKKLDENHSYLLASDVKDFEQYKTAFDDDIKVG